MYGDAYATTFRPDDTITRAEGALVLVRILFGQETIDNATITNRFPDINETYEEAQKAISVATEFGINSTTKNSKSGIKNQLCCSYA